MDSRDPNAELESEGSRFRLWLGKKLRPPKSRTAETPDKDPRNHD